MVPLITSESAFGQNVSKLVSGVDVCDLDLRVWIDLVKQPIKRNSAGSGYVSHRWTSAFDDHLDDRFVVFKNAKQRSGERFAFGTSVKPQSSDCVRLLLRSSIGTCFTLYLLCNKSPCALGVWFEGECHTSITKSQRSRAETPSMRKPAPEDMASDSEEMCETAVCFLHIQLFGTNV